MKLNASRFKVSLSVLLQLASLLIISAAVKANTTTENLLAMSITELLNVRVSSVSKHEQPLSKAPASIYVITQEDIQTAGATTLPEALRLAPRIQVARISSSQYAISTRGFNNAVSNKLLVLIDGRSVYTPLFSGVFWDQQDVLLEDIERIEVISGPGATLWGTNAVNGVINVITREAAETQGWLAAAHAGNSERGVRARYGSRFGTGGNFRVYSKIFESDSSARFMDSANPHDGTDRLQAGFRSDWRGAVDEITLQGDIYRTESEDRGIFAGYTLGSVNTSGNNLLARWRRQLEGEADFRVQAYWDYAKRRDIILFQPRADIFDLEVQYGVPLGDHRLLWGAGYRHGRDEVEPGFFSTFVPDSRRLQWKNLFAMDEWTLTDDVKATIGLRLEHNDYTGLEYLPTVRLAWQHAEQSLLWGAISRAVRAPSRYDRDVYFPAPPNSIVVGGPNFQSEVAHVLAVGNRGSAFGRVTYSVTAYYHDWDKLRSGSAIPVEIENKIEGEVYGLEFWANYQITPAWKVSAGGTRLHKDLRLEADSTDPVGVENDTLANDPNYYGQVRSTLEIGDTMTFEIAIRHMEELPKPSISSYTLLDANYLWELNSQLTMSFTAQNLTDDKHTEFGRPGSVNEFGRMAWLSLTWTR